MKDVHLRPTPAMGIPSVRPTSEETRPEPPPDPYRTAAEREDDPAMAILAAIDDLKKEARATREEHAIRFDKLDRKVDEAVERLTSEDAALRLDYRRLESRQAAGDEDVRILRNGVNELREDVRKEREERSKEKVAMAETFEAVKRHVEATSRANTEQVAAAVAAMTERDTRQDGRLDALEKQGGAMVSFAGAVCEELAIDAPDGIEKPKGNGDRKSGGTLTRIAAGAEGMQRRVTWAAVALAALQIAGYIIVKLILGSQLP